MSKLKTEVVFVERNGRTLSKRTSYFENGQVAHVGLYGNGHGDWSWNVPVGVEKKYFENGQLESEISYNESGSKDGESNFYDKNGKLIRKCIHSKDVLVQEQIFEVPMPEKIKLP